MNATVAIKIQEPQANKTCADCVHYIQVGSYAYCSLYEEMTTPSTAKCSQGFDMERAEVINLHAEDEF